MAEFVDIVADVQGPPFDLIWTHILGVLIGQADGKVFVPERAVLALDRFKLVIERDPVRYGWNVWLQPDHSDGSPCPRCGGRGQVYYPGDHIVDCELCTAHSDSEA